MGSIEGEGKVKVLSLSGRLERLTVEEKKVDEQPLSVRSRRLNHTIRDVYDEDLETFVRNSETKRVGEFQFGDVYLGTFEGKNVVVKIWTKQGRNQVLPGENEGRLEDEILLQNYFFWYEFHPNMAKLQNFCRGPKYLAAIYHVEPKAIDTLHNLIEKDDFAWRYRIKVAFGLASLLRFMHTPHPKCPSDVPYLIRNIDAAHILVDQDHEALLFDFSMISGGILTDKRELLNQKIHGCSGYSDPYCAQPAKESYKDGSDHERPVYLWARDEQKLHNSGNKLSLVNHSLKSEPDFHFDDAIAIANLAMKCCEPKPQKRPTMEDVVTHMQGLRIVQQNADTWECCRMLDGVNEIFQSSFITKDNRVKWQPSIWQLGLSNKRRMHIDKCQTLKLKDLDHNPASSKSSIGEDSVIKVFCYKDLIMATDEFSDENLIGKFQFGKVFRGETKENKKVTVKIWETIDSDWVCQKGNEDRLRDEISLLQHPMLLSHRNMVKMIGYCFEDGKLGGVYDLDPLDSLHNLAPKSTDKFSWLQRMKVIYEFANLLMYLHTLNPPHVPYRVGNIDAAHIILDKEYSPKLLDFGMTVGGIILSSREKRIKKVRKRRGYYWDSSQGSFHEARDIFAFGCIILCLIQKRVPTPDPDVDEDDRFVPHYEVEREYEDHVESKKSNAFSFVHKSLEQERGFNKNDGVELTNLAMDCIDSCAYDRPSMQEVVRKLGNLQVIKKMGIKKLYQVQC